MELENTTADATITDLLGAVNARCGGAHPYAFVNTGGTLGTDAIRVALDLPHGRPLAGRRAAGRPRSGPQPAADRADVRRRRCDEPGLRPALHGDRQPLQVEGLPRAPAATPTPATARAASTPRATAQANRAARPGSTAPCCPAAGDPDVLLLGDFNAYAAGGPDHDARRPAATPTSRPALLGAGRVLLPLRRPARPSRLRLRQRQPRRRRSPASAPGTSTPTRCRCSTTTTRSTTARRGGVRGEAGRLGARAAARRVPAGLALPRLRPRPGARRPVPGRRPGDHQDRRRPTRSPAAQRDLHDHRHQQRSGPRRRRHHRERRLPAGAHVHVDLRRRRGRPVQRKRIRRLRRRGQPAGGRQRHLHRELRDQLRRRRARCRTRPPSRRRKTSSTRLRATTARRTATPCLCPRIWRLPRPTA